MYLSATKKLVYDFTDITKPAKTKISFKNNNFYNIVPLLSMPFSNIHPFLQDYYSQEDHDANYFAINVS